MADKDNELEIMEMLDKASRGEKLGNENMKSVFEKTKSRSRLTTSKKALLVTVTVVAGLAILPIPIIMYNKNRNKNIGGQVSIDYNINEAEDVEIKFKKGDTIGSLQATDIPGYRFDGWYGDEDFTNKLSNEMQIADDDDLQIFGRYIRIHNVTITVKDGFNNVDTKEIIVDDGQTIEDAINKLELSENCKAVGFYTDSNFETKIDDTISSSIVEEDKEIYYKYVKEIDVEIVIDGETEFSGTMSEDDTETLEQQIAAYYSPREGYVFKGWYHDGVIVDISNLTKKNYVLLGRYVETLDFNVVVDGVETSISSNAEDATQDLNNFCVTENVSDYTTCGWFNDAELTQRYNGELEEGQTIYTKRATLDKIEYEIHSEGKYIAKPIDKSVEGEIVLPVIPEENYSTVELQGFENCANITEIVVTNDVTINSFAGCTSLQKINIPSESIITANAFKGLPNLTSVVIGNDVEIGNSAFEGCISLERVTLPYTITSIGNNVFKGCSKLGTIDIEALVDGDETIINLESIESGAFEGCVLLTELDLSECSKLNKIVSGAFKGCTGLTNVVLPKGFWYKSTSAENVNGPLVDKATDNILELLKDETLHLHRVEDILIKQNAIEIFESLKGYYENAKSLDNLEPGYYHEVPSTGETETEIFDGWLDGETPSTLETLEGGYNLSKMGYAISIASILLNLEDFEFDKFYSVSYLTENSSYDGNWMNGPEFYENTKLWSISYLEDRITITEFRHNQDFGGASPQVRDWYEKIIHDIYYEGDKAISYEYRSHDLPLGPSGVSDSVHYSKIVMPTYEGLIFDEVLCFGANIFGDSDYYYLDIYSELTQQYYVYEDDASFYVPEHIKDKALEIMDSMGVSSHTELPGGTADKFFEARKDDIGYTEAIENNIEFTKEENTEIYNALIELLSPGDLVTEEDE